MVVTSILLLCCLTLTICLFPPPSSRSEQVCLESSDLLHMHLALAGMRLIIIVVVYYAVVGGPHNEVLPRLRRKQGRGKKRRRGSEQRLRRRQRWQKALAQLPKQKSLQLLQKLLLLLRGMPASSVLVCVCVYSTDMSKAGQACLYHWLKQIAAQKRELMAAAIRTDLFLLLCSTRQTVGRTGTVYVL